MVKKSKENDPPSYNIMLTYGYAVINNLLIHEMFFVHKRRTVNNDR